MGMSYKKAGVNINNADEAVRRIKKLAKSTRTKGVLADVGSFGGLFKVDSKYKDPVLVSSTDGVGTKLKLAYMTGIHNTMGQDLVNHCTDDILVQGAEPLFFMDYIGTGKLDPKVMESIISGFAKACRENGCALLGGEMAELPGMYKKGEYDLAGFVVGVVERSKLIDGSKIRPGDVLIGIKSSGFHTNGYSLVYKVLGRWGARKYAKELMKTHVSYLKPVKKVLKKFSVRGMAHITGGGFEGNIPRILPENCSVEIDKSSWTVPNIFKIIQNKGKVEENEMYKVFNMGIGMIVFVQKKDAENVVKLIGSNARIIGRVTKGNRKVILK